jgi:hypothetical protein
MVDTPAVLRRQEYWSILAGAAGQLYGNGYTWPFKPGWKDKLDTPGAVQMAAPNRATRRAIPFLTW